VLHRDKNNQVPRNEHDRIRAAWAPRKTKEESMKRTFGLIVVALAVLAVPCNSAMADDNLIRFGGAGFVPVDVFSDLENGYGVFVDYERILSTRIGLDLELQFAHYPDSTITETVCVFDICDELEADIGGLDMIPVTVSPNIHLTPGKSVDLYVRPSIGFAYTKGDDDSETDFAYGAGLGLDVGSNKWFFVAGVDWLSVAVDADDNFDNVIARAGAGIRF
jgi:hypothetical protein